MKNENTLPDPPEPDATERMRRALPQTPKFKEKLGTPLRIMKSMREQDYGDPWLALGLPTEIGAEEGWTPPGQLLNGNYFLTSSTAELERLQRMWDYPGDARNPYRLGLHRALGERRVTQQLLDAYARQITRMTGEIARIEEICRQAGRTPPPDAGVRESILSRLQELLNKAAAPGSPLNKASITESLSDIGNAALRRMQVLLSFVPANMLEELRIETLEEFTVQAFQPAANLRSDPPLHKRTLDMITENYPKGDDAVFERFLEDPHAEFYALLCGEEGKKLPVIIAGLERGFAGNLSYVDWLCADKDSKLRGLSPATMRALIRLFWTTHGTFHAAKPYVASLRMILSIGGVCDGIAEPDEYKDDGYVLTRWLHGEQGAYPARLLGEDRIRTTLERDGTMLRQQETAVPTNIDGHPVLAFRTEFRRMNHRTSVKPDEHPFYAALADARRKGYVLTAMTPTSDSTPMRQRFYAIFEPDALPDAGGTLDAARAQRCRKHAS